MNTSPTIRSGAQKQSDRTRRGDSVRPLSRHLNEAHPQVSIIALQDASFASTVLEDQSQFGAGCNAIPDELLVLRTHFVRFEGRITRFIDRKQVRVNGVALRVADTPRLVKTNFHVISSTQTLDASRPSGN